MASGTIYGSTGNQYIDSKIEWTSTVNNSANTSSVTAKLYYKRNNTGFTTSGTGTFTISIDGVKSSASKTLNITEDAWVLAVSGTATVNHKDDGTKSIVINASGSIPSTTLSSTSCSGSVKLDTIPRASTISSLPNIKLDTNCEIKWTPKSASFRYKVRIASGSWVHTAEKIHPNKTSQYTYTYKLPLDIANQMPIDSKLVNVGVTLTTYSDSNATNEVGYDTDSFLAILPDNELTKPSVSMTLEAVNSLGSAFEGLYIKGLSKVKASLIAEGKYGADISSYSLTMLGKSYNTSPYQSDYLTTSGKITVTGKATDSRGLSNTNEQEITVISYDKPMILPASGESKIICARCDSSGNLSESGTYLKIKATRSYSTVTSNGVQKNFCAIRYRYVKEGSKFSGDEGWVTLLAGSTTSTDTVNKILSGVVSSTETSYVVQVGVIDEIGNSDVVQFVIPTDFVTIDIPEEHNGKRIGLLRYAQDTDEPGIDVGAPIHGGSIDSLKIGTPLLATEAAPIDLNDMKTPGCYYSPGASYSQYILNTPYTDGGFGLEVREMQSVNYIRHELYYGRTRWTRHWNTEKWSAWLRFLMSSSEDDTVEDFVISAGTYETDYGTWTYKKWYSGTYQMFGSFDVTPTESTIRTSVYRTNSIGIPAPFSLANAFLSGSVMGHYWISNGGISEDHKSIAFRLLSDKEFSTTTAIEVRLSVMGKYE